MTSKDGHTSQFCDKSLRGLVSFIPLIDQEKSPESATRETLCS
jgi:hypothetical protein